MSEDLKTKRKRIETQNSNQTEVKERPSKISTINQNPSLEDFNWESYEAGCPSQSRKVNQKLDTPTGWKVFSKATYAEDLLNQMLKHEEITPTRFDVREGNTYNGRVHTVSEEWATVDINHREMVYIDMGKENTETLQSIVPGNEVEVQILRRNNQKSRAFILGSVSEGIKTAAFNEIMDSIEGGSTAYSGRVKEMIVGGGYIVTVNGVDCFMPGSLAGINKLHDFESIIGTDMYVVPMSFSTKRGTIVVSHREYLKALIPNAVEELRNNLEGVKTGHVTGTTKFGVFVEFNQCLTGMIHYNDLTLDYSKKHKAREIKPGDHIEFYIKEIINNNKIILSQIQTEPVKDPWDGIEERYQTPCEVHGTVKSVKDYGLFVDIEDGVTGLLHISEIVELIDVNTIKPGDAITVQVTRVESSTRKVYLKI